MGPVGPLSAARSDANVRLVMRTHSAAPHVVWVGRAATAAIALVIALLAASA
jgi:hypothetical protein